MHTSAKATHICLTIIQTLQIYSLIDTSHLKYRDPWISPWEILHPSLYPDQHQNVTGSILGRDPSSIKVLWKSVQQFLLNPAHKPTNHQTDTDETIRRSTVVSSPSLFLFPGVISRSRLPRPEEESAFIGWDFFLFFTHTRNLEGISSHSSPFIF